jgi:hypothetical protein
VARYGWQASIADHVLRTPTLERVAEAKVHAVGSWLHIVSDGDPEYLVASCTRDAEGEPVVSIAALKVSHVLAGTLDNDERVPWREVTSESTSYRVNDIWHVFAHGCHWISYSGGGDPDGGGLATKDPYLRFAQVVRSGTAFTVVEEVRITKAEDPTPFRDNANDHFIVPTASGIAIATAARLEVGAGTLYLHYRVVGDDPTQSGYLQFDRLSYIGGNAFQSDPDGQQQLVSAVGGAGYWREPGRGSLPRWFFWDSPPVKELGPKALHVGGTPWANRWQVSGETVISHPGPGAVELYVPHTLDPISGSEIRRIVTTPRMNLRPSERESLGYDTPFPQLGFAETLIDYRGYADGVDAHLAMATAINLGDLAGPAWSNEAGSPFSPGPALEPQRWVLVTYRVISPLLENKGDADEGEVHRRLYRIPTAGWLRSADWLKVWQERIPSDLALTDDFGRQHLNRPHTLRWGDYVLTAMTTDHEVDSQPNPERGGILIVERWS